MKQKEYDDKMSDITSEKVKKRPTEQKEEEFPPEQLILASTDTTYDQDPEVLPTLSNVGAKPVAKQKVDEDEPVDEPQDTTQSDTRIFKAIAVVATIAFLGGGEASLDENTLSTLLALGAFFGMVHFLNK